MLARFQGVHLGVSRGCRWERLRDDVPGQRQYQGGTSSLVLEEAFLPLETRWILMRLVAPRSGL